MDPTEAACDLARKIAKSKTKGRNYRDNVIGDALLAVAQGVTDREGLELACRNSERREWKWARKTVSLDSSLDEYRTEAPARATPDLWEAIKALPPRQYKAVVLVYWGGLTQEEAATEMDITQPSINELLHCGIENLKLFLRAPYKTPSPDAVSSRRTQGLAEPPNVA